MIISILSIYFNKDNYPSILNKNFIFIFIFIFILFILIKIIIHQY